MSISGSFVRGNYSGRMIGYSNSFYKDDSVMRSASLWSGGFYRDESSVVSSSIPPIFIRNKASSEGNIALQGLAFGAPTSMDGSGNFGRHMQVGLFQQNMLGSPTAPSMELDYPGSMWRFRWVVKGGTRSISVLAQQNSTGSYRPSMVIKANPVVGIMTDISASASDGAGWINIGPINFTATSGSAGAVWVELHNNNYGMTNLQSDIAIAPAYFDHIIVT